MVLRYDVYDGNKKILETYSKAEAIAAVISHNSRTRTKTFEYRQVREDATNTIVPQPVQQHSFD